MSIAELRVRPGGWLGSHKPRANKRSGHYFPLFSSPAASKRPGRRGRPGAQPRSTVLGALIITLFRVVAWTLALLVSVLVLGAVSLGLVHGYRSLTASEHFAVSGVEITGNRQVPTPELLNLTGISVGESILEVSLGEINARLLRNPWIESVAVRRILPNAVSINVVEREPYFWIQQTGTLYYADRHGVPIVPVELARFISLPSLILETNAGVDQDGFQDWLRALERMEYPFGFQEIAWLKLKEMNIVRLYLEDRGLEVSLDLGSWRENGRLMNLVWEDLRARGELGLVGRIEVMAGKVWVQAKATS